MWLHLANWNFTDFLLWLESKTEPSVAKAQNYIGGGGDTAQKYLYWKRGGHRTYLVDEWNKSSGDNAQHWKKAYTGRGGHRTYFVGVGTPHNIYKKSLAVSGWVGRLRSLWVVGCAAYELGGWGVRGPSQRIMPLCGSILQVGTCQILSLAQNPRWSRVWQNPKDKPCISVASYGYFA